MKETSTDPSYLDRVSSWARSKAHGQNPLASDTSRPSLLPISNATTLKSSDSGNHHDLRNLPPFPSTDANGLARQTSKPTANNVAESISGSSPPPAPPPQADGEGSDIRPEGEKPKKHVAMRFYLTGKTILLSSWINVLLVFVPIGIAADVAKLNPIVIFFMNAIAIVPLAGLLSHATESVAKRMGDTIGALMNVTFGNAVELIIFIIALTKDEIRIVQASLLGSILSNLLLILGMCFLLGGLRFREQIYNSTVTQMSACLLSLAVMSLLLPTAFHASFLTDTADQRADASSAVLKVSRGTSVILLLVYGLYLLFQLKSHAYMYESTPQHIIDEESQPGPAAAWMDSSSDDSSSSSSSDSDSSSNSNTTASRIKRVMRGGRKRRKSSVVSKETESPRLAARASSYTSNAGDGHEGSAGHKLGALDLDHDGDDEAIHAGTSSRSSAADKIDKAEAKAARKMRKKQKKRRREKKSAASPVDDVIPENEINEKNEPNDPRRVDFALANNTEIPSAEVPKRPFNLRAISIRPALPKTFSQNVFAQPSGPPQPGPAQATGPIPLVKYGIRRTNSLPDRLNQITTNASTPAGNIHPLSVRQNSSMPITVAAEDEEEENISRTTAVVLLVISTGLVALCAEFMVSSISAVTTSTALGETFVGLIILPIVGNAAEHVTAVTVAAKNKMDLAIGVAVGSSIQIALFVTPLIVLLGWAMGKEMNLYFTLFETVSLFVSAFIVNFLVLDGRSNYLEGALLMCAYLIIAVAAFFYPQTDQQSALGGNNNATDAVARMLMG